ncbi:MAG: serine hydrolase domain-containing protein [Saprospiraceae bacterium]
MKPLLALALAVLCTCGFSQTTFTDQIDSILTAQLDAARGPGLTVGVVKDGKMIYHDSRGLMNLEYDLPFNDSTTIGIASITKQFTSACVAILERQGKLSVEDDVRKYIPELTFHGDTIRIKHLLSHTSGIRNHNVLLDLSGFDLEHRGYTNKMIQELMFSQKGVNNKPGDKMLYSNTNYVMAALLVERVSGRPIHQFAQEELFAPLGMTGTFYRKDLSKIIKNSAHSYYPERGMYKEQKSLTLCVGAGGVGSTIADLTIWSNVMLDPDHKFSFVKNFVTQLEPLNSGEPMQHARGMFVTPYKSQLTFNHSGRGLGMRSQLICVPDLNIAVIVFSNSEIINAVNVSYSILDLWIDELEETKESMVKIQHSEKELNSFTGQFQELNSDLKMRLFLDNDTLKAKSSFGRNAIPLSVVGKNMFSRHDNASVTYEFKPEGESEADLLVNFGGAIFYLERVELSPKPNKNLTEFAGHYFSEELGVEYHLSSSNGNLFLSYPNNQDLMIKEGVKDVFGANRRTKYTFARNASNEVVSFQVASEGTVKGILFEKVD